MHRFGWVLALTVSCAAAPREVKPTLADYPGTLKPPSAYPGDFMRRQTIVARYHDKTQSFEAVLQKKGDKLTMIGFGPAGIKAFILEQTGAGVTFKPLLKHEMPFPPEFMLLDIQRTYFDSLSPEAQADGWHETDRDGERIRERWAGGRLMERQFTRLKSDPPGTIDIVYVDGMKGPESPAVIELDNGWFGYHLTIRTVAQQAL